MVRLGKKKANRLGWDGDDLADKDCLGVSISGNNRINHKAWVSVSCQCCLQGRDASNQDLVGGLMEGVCRNLH